MIYGKSYFPSTSANDHRPTTTYLLPKSPPPQNKGLAVCWQLPPPADQASRMRNPTPGFAPRDAPVATQECANALSPGDGPLPISTLNGSCDISQSRPQAPESPCF